MPFDEIESVNVAGYWLIYDGTGNIKSFGHLGECPYPAPMWLEEFLVKHSASWMWVPDAEWPGDVSRMWVVDGKLTKRDPGWKDPAEVDRAKREAALKKAMALGATAIGDTATAASLEAEIP